MPETDVNRGEEEEEAAFDVSIYDCCWICALFVQAETKGSVSGEGVAGPSKPFQDNV